MANQLKVDHAKWVQPAVRSDVSGPTVATAVAILQIHAVLEQMARSLHVNDDPDMRKKLDEIKKQGTKLSEYWTTLVGEENDG